MSNRNSLKLVPRSSGSTQETAALAILSEERPGKWPVLAWFFLFNVLVTFLVVSEADMFPPRLSASDVGKRVRKPLISRRSFTFTPDRELLELMADEAAARVLPVYSVRLNGWTELWRTHITYAFRAVEDPVFHNQDDLVRERFNQLARVDLDPITFRVLQELEFPKFKSALQTLFTNVLKDRLLVPDVDAFLKKHPNGIELLVEPKEIDSYNTPTVLRIGPDYKELLDLRRLTTLFQSEIETRFALGDRDNIHEDGRRALLKVAVALIQSHLQPKDPASTVSLNLRERPDLTAERQKEARRQIVRKPQIIQKGEVLLPADARITLETVKIYNTMLPRLGSRLLGLFGYFILISAFFAVTIWFSTLKFGGARGRTSDFYICGALFLVFLLLVRVGWALTTGIVPQPDPILFPALFPAAGAALLVKILIGTRLAVFFAVAMSFIATWTIGAPVQISIYYFVTGLAAAGVVTRVEHRNVLWKSGLVIALSGLFLVLTYRLVGGNLVDRETLRLSVIAVLGGLILSVLLSGLLPVLEYVGGYVTDIKLLELANTEHPLLQELREKAIGTFQHSQQVAELAFAAAKKVGANPLLVKVAAMYHDVGKTRQPKYYIENQSGEKNPHDELKPSMSALIIKGHVKETRDTLEKAGIPAKVISVAASHHGSTLIEYFYRRAQSLAQPGEEVPEEVYRYSGPVPQTREAGILMLADAVEAAVRSKVKAAAMSQSKDPKDQKKFDVNTIKETVQSIINTKFTDGQLDACELTLRDMRTIADSFISTLSSIHHERVSYSVAVPEKANVTRRSSSSFAVVSEVQDNDGKKDSQPHPGPPRLGKK
ncbi:MAG: hypothetical protein CVU59_09765 [Deltaproteobacteria bacterium HGW-Deltaproteobacteria-17]|nr:MAG: hypothetical protein CVU59_09765 [Deltaproteobacteria bacterium HGW-Deltaproteobacteria-17]